MSARLPAALERLRTKGSEDRSRKGTRARVKRMGAIVFVAKVFCSVAGSTFKMDSSWSMRMPALLMRRSSLHLDWWSWVTTFSIESIWVISSVRNSVRGFSAERARRCSAGNGALRAVARTYQPWAASCLAVSNPMPRFAPVIRAILVCLESEGMSGLLASPWS